MTKFIRHNPGLILLAVVVLASAIFLMTRLGLASPAWQTATLGSDVEMPAVAAITTAATSTAVTVTATPVSQTATATSRNTETLIPTATPACQPDLQQLQMTMQSVFPKTLWGVVYAGRGAYTSYFVGVSTGETATRTVQGTSGQTRKIDLARFYFVHEDGTLDDVWVALGFALEGGTAPSATPEPYHSFNDWSAYPDYKKWGWYSGEEARALLSTKGLVYHIGFEGTFLDKNGLQWNKCRAVGTAIPLAACDIGPVIDPGGSAEFFAEQALPEGWFIFGYSLAPNGLILWGDPVLTEIDISEVCP